MNGNALVGYNGFDMDNGISGYGESIIGAADYGSNNIDDILAGLGYDPMENYNDAGDVGAVPPNLMAMVMRALHQMKRGHHHHGHHHHGPRIVPVHNRHLRRYPLGLGSTTVTAGAAAVISVQPQLPFKLERFVTAATGFLINNIQVGTVSQFVAAGAVPGEIFTPNAFGVELRGDTAVPGVQIQITVTNNNVADTAFSGAFLGLVAQ